MVEERGWDEFVHRYAMFGWIEVGRAEAWFYTWLDPQSMTFWLSTPEVQEALAEVRKGSKATTTPSPSSTAPTATVIDPSENKVRLWFSGIVTDHLNRGTRITKEPAFELAFAEFPEINKHWFFERIYKPPAVPKQWTGRGRPKGSRNKKGK